MRIILVDCLLLCCKQTLLNEQNMAACAPKIIVIFILKHTDAIGTLDNKNAGTELFMTRPGILRLLRHLDDAVFMGGGGKHYFLGKCSFGLFLFCLLWGG